MSKTGGSSCAENVTTKTHGDMGVKDYPIMKVKSIGKTKKGRNGCDALQEIGTC